MPHIHERTLAPLLMHDRQVHEIQNITHASSLLYNRHVHDANEIMHAPLLLSYMMGTFMTSTKKDMLPGCYTQDISMK